MTSLYSAKSSAEQPLHVLIPTVIINICDKYGNFFPCRAILDSASQLNFISERLSQRLGLRRKRSTISICGIGNQSNLSSNFEVHCTISSKFNKFSVELDAVIIPSITSLQPSTLIDISSWKIPGNVSLSDPEFFKPNRVDFLIGAEMHYQLMQVGQISLGKNLPVIQKTLLGWVVTGKTLTANIANQQCLLTSAPAQNGSLSEILRKFWELENHLPINPTSCKSQEEQACETHFKKNCKRNQFGRFIVKLPFKGDPTCLGDSVQNATRRFLSLERRLHKDPTLLTCYKDFIEEYLQLQHMRKLSDSEAKDIKYVLPHHCVLKPESSSTKLRVVFDGSSKTSTNCSLNDILMVGPVIQQDLFSVILRFRKHAIAITSDICKMYRQVLVDNEDCKFQNIIWRDHPSKKLEYFQLLTVTYGTAPASFLATRCLFQLGIDKEHTHPPGANVVKSDFYVDDLITGAETLAEAKELKEQVEHILQSGGFELKKWSSNCKEFLEEILPDRREKPIQFCDTDIIKTLGLIWSPVKDTFSFRINFPIKDRPQITKRTVLADIASIFDPMGLINPIVVLGKIFMQRLWLLQISWDESLPVELHSNWLKYKNQLKLLESFEFPRRLHSLDLLTDIQLHAFSDASEKAYGSCVYLRCTDIVGNTTIRLICAKSRVAPVKHVTIPRLELCAAQLMAQLVSTVIQSLNISINEIYYWTDSKIVLAWLSEPSSHWNTFVANRTGSIQELTNLTSWRYVETTNNPADLVSRGTLPADLLQSHMWFNGPSFLNNQETPWRDNEPRQNTLIQTPERRKIKSVFISSATQDIVEQCKYINSFLKLQRVFAFVMRFIRQVKSRARIACHYALSVDELNEGLKYIIRIVQRNAFLQDILSLQKHGQVKATSRIKTLSPFIDPDGILRVGGRIENAEIPFDARHPMLLPNSHPFTKTLMSYLHHENMHAGPQTLLAITRQRFWPLRGLNVAKKIVHSCIRCFRTKPKHIHQIMGNLPPERVQPSRPFTNTGVDFCGPFYTTLKIKGKPPIKTYLAIFVCFSTKAVHIELASDLSTNAFILALRRFIGRRGLPANIYCDNATNFVGASSSLKELRDMFSLQESRNEILSECSKRFINFNFIPPRSPHFGGLWEAAVKSAKYHLKRVSQGFSFTFEELNTLAVQVEAILNSRPIQAMSSDPNDPAALTPGHFLIGGPLTEIIEPSSKDLQIKNLDRWQRIQWAKEQFWSRWTKSYLNQLQNKYKWHSTMRNLNINDLVLIKDDNLPPMHWNLGRVVTICPGNDGKVRVAAVRTKNGLIKRSVIKLCPLPMNCDN